MKFNARAILFFLVTVAFAVSAQAATLRYDGLYHARDREGNNHYIRFYPDGAVVYTVSTGTPKQVARWLRKHFSYFGGDGRYTITGDRIQMRTAERDGPVNYWGTIKQGDLQLTSDNFGANSPESLQYRFASVRFAH